jgi:hypothetical protein
LKPAVDSGQLGELINMQHLEPVGSWHLTSFSLPVSTSEYALEYLPSWCLSVDDERAAHDADPSLADRGRGRTLLEARLEPLQLLIGQFRVRPGRTTRAQRLDAIGDPPTCARPPTRKSVLSRLRLREYESVARASSAGSASNHLRLNGGYRSVTSKNA